MSKEKKQEGKWVNQMKVLIISASFLMIAWFVCLSVYSLSINKRPLPITVLCLQVSVCFEYAASFCDSVCVCHTGVICHKVHAKIERKMKEEANEAAGCTGKQTLLSYCDI